MTRVLGLDLSLTATGCACPTCGTGVIASKPQTDRIQRLADIAKEIMGHAVVHPDRVDVAVIEGYAFGSARGSSQMHSLGELGGIVRMALWEQNIPIVEVPPATLKKWTTDKGNAPKDAMLAAAIRKFGFEGEDNNEADAFLLAAIGRQVFDHGEMPIYQRTALAKLQWPELASA